MNLDWLNEVEFEDLLDKDCALIHDLCGPDVLKSLWQHLPSLPLFVSTKPLNEARRRYIRKYWRGDTKILAVKLGVSERFVQEAIATTDAKDDRQGSLLK